MPEFKSLDPLLHNELRLKIVSLLISLEKASFNFLLEKTEASKGNLSVQLKKLQTAGYLKMEKSFKDNYPHTEAKLTKKGVQSFERYVEAINSYLQNDKKEDG